MGSKRDQPPQAKTPEAKYSASEIAANATRLFGYSVDVARAAFDCSGIKECTLNEAKHIIQSFAERQV